MKRSVASELMIAILLLTTCCYGVFGQVEVRAKNEPAPKKACTCGKSAGDPFADLTQPPNSSCASKAKPCRGGCGCSLKPVKCPVHVPAVLVSNPRTRDFSSSFECVVVCNLPQLGELPDGGLCPRFCEVLEQSSFYLYLNTSKGTRAPPA